MKTFKVVPVIILMILLNSLLFSQSVIKQRLDSVIYVGTTDKYDYLYNSLGQNTSVIYYTWNNSLLKYEKVSKMDYSYNDKGLCNLDQKSLWDKDLKLFVLSRKNDFNYDEYNQQLISNAFAWNGTDKNWVHYAKYDFENTYNGQKLASTILFENLLKKEKYVFTYDTNGLTSTIYSSWNNSFGRWDIRKKEEYTYDSESNLTKMQSFSYSALSVGGMGWIISDAAVIYLYNNTYTTNQLIIPHNYIFPKMFLPSDFKVNHMITKINLPNEIFLRYYYSSMEVTGINDLEALKTTIFPNPATDFLNIQWIGNQHSLNVELVDISGKKVFTGMIENNSKLPIQVYPKGLYLINISDNNKTIKTEKVSFQ
jgi:hypothetical protein